MSSCRRPWVINAARKKEHGLQGWSEFREEGEQAISQEDAITLLKCTTTLMLSSLKGGIIIATFFIILVVNT